MCRPPLDLRAMRVFSRVLGTSRHRICTVSTATLNDIINSCINNGRTTNARRLFDLNPSSRNVVSWNLMISGYVKHHQVQHAQLMFDEMPVRDVVSWNTMLTGLQKTRDPGGIYNYFLQMGRGGLKPNEFTFSIIISALLDTSFNSLIPQFHCLTICLALNSSVFVGSALMRGYTDLKDRVALQRVFDEILPKDVTSWNALILGYMDLGLTAEARRSFEMMPGRNIISWTTLVNGYIQNMKLHEARSIFNEISEKNVVLWTAMISGYVRYGWLVQALELFLLMLKSGSQPNHFTFASALDACAGCSSLLMGAQLHSKIWKSGVTFDVILSTSLVDMYAKCGDIDAASRVFKAIPRRNLVSWNSIIGGYARHGLASRALEEFESMTRSGVNPDQVTFVNVLSACVHGGLVEEGEKHFNSMATKYGINAAMEHYACMVCLYGRAGYPAKAVRLIEEMPSEPDLVVWSALLAACSLQSNSKGDVQRRERSSCCKHN